MPQLIKDYSEVLLKKYKEAGANYDEVIQLLSHEYNVAMDLLYTTLMAQSRVITIHPTSETNIDKWKQLAKQYNIEIDFVVS